MFQPSHPDSGSESIVAVRGGRSGPVTCATCGCRLEPVDGAWFHFGRLGGRDARGCRVACVESAHGADGLATASLAS
jgi:hypothetical protein